MKQFSIKPVVTGYIFFGLLIWLAAIVGAPFLAAGGEQAKKLANWIYFFFQPVCHQIPGRSFIFHNHPIAVCVRCFAIYGGAFISITLFILNKNMSPVKMKTYLIAIMPALAVIVVGKYISYFDDPVIRSVTGFLLGFVIMHMIAQSLVSNTAVKVDN